MNNNELEKNIAEYTENFDKTFEPAVGNDLQHQAEIAHEVMDRQTKDQETEKLKDRWSEGIRQDILARHGRVEGRALFVPTVFRTESGEPKRGLGEVGYALPANEEGTRHYIYTPEGEEIIVGPPNEDDENGVERYKKQFSPSKMPYIIDGGLTSSSDVGDALVQNSKDDLRVIHTNASQEGASKISEFRKTAFDLAAQKQKTYDEERGELRLSSMNQIVRAIQPGRSTSSSPDTQ